MIIYGGDGSNKYHGSGDMSNNWLQSLKRTTSCRSAVPPPPPKRRKLTAKNKQFLSSLGFKVLNKAT